MDQRVHPPRPGPGFDAEPGEPLPLKDAVQQSLTEARMVLPGLQALFGFQMIAVFNERFAREVGPVDQWLHLGSLLAVALTIGLVMTPAAYHRQVHRDEVTRGLLRVATRLVGAAFAPLSVGLALDLHVVTHLVTGRLGVSVATGAVAGVLLLLLWYGFPAWARWRRSRARLR